MTVNANTPYTQQIVVGTQSKFTLQFQFERASDLNVYQTPSGQTPDPVTDILTLNTDYTVIGAGWGVETERSVNLVVAANNGDTITIVRDMPLDRETDFAVSGDFSAADLNDQFDDVVGMIQQVDSKIENRGLLYIDNQILDQNGSNYWVGFDCAHLDDGQDPELPFEVKMSNYGKEVRTTEYVEKECKELIDQMIKVGESK